MTPSLHSSPASPKLSLFAATSIGVASMLGAGVFVVFAPASALAGEYLLISILLAGLVAALNARSIRQLAQVLPKSGGAYAFGREFISKGWGFLAGIAFIFGKIGSVASIALAAASYIYPAMLREIALLAIALMTLINILGINRTALGAMILSAPTIALLILVGVSGFSGTAQIQQAPFSVSGVISAAALIFFAFAGYARVATIGEEVREPTKNVPRAIILGLGTVLALYLLVGNALQANLGDSLALAVAPIRDLAERTLPWLPLELVTVVAATACLGSLLSLLAGISRTAEAMANDQELPKAISIRSKRFQSPWIAETVIAAVAMALVVSGKIIWTIGISSFAVLIYYAIANWAAFNQLGRTKPRSRIAALLGGLLCLALATFVPLESLGIGLALLAGSLVVRAGLIKLRGAR